MKNVLFGGGAFFFCAEMGNGKWGMGAGGFSASFVLIDVSGETVRRETSAFSVLGR